MLSKRKTEEIDIKDVEKVKSKMNILSYIEEEREKMMVDIESPDSIENYLYQSLKRLKDESTLNYYRLSRMLSFGSNAIQSVNLVPSPANRHGVSFSTPLHASSGTLLVSETTRLFEPITRRNPPPEFHRSGNSLGYNRGSDPINNRGPLNQWLFCRTPPQLYRNPIYRNQIDAQNFNVGPDTMWGSHFQNSSVSTVSDDSLVAQLIVILRDWNLDLYQKCMDDYNSKRNENPDFWDKMVLKVLPPIMLEHCAKADIVADFFHTMAKHKCNALVKLKMSYLQFFLMNMAAVNRIEHSMIVETDKWNSAKRELIEKTFVAGQLANLQLLLQYFRPNDLWSCADMEFLKAPSTRWESRADHIENIEHVYCDNLIMLNLVRVATYVAASHVPRNILTDCIRLFWRASETPYVTREVLNEAFKPLNSSLLLRHTLIRASKDPFIEAYPEDCVAEYQPRSLMHLSRCKIRQTLTSAVHVPSLPLPQKLKAYINLEW